MLINSLHPNNALQLTLYIIYLQIHSMYGVDHLIYFELNEAVVSLACRKTHSLIQFSSRPTSVHLLKSPLAIVH